MNMTDWLHAIRTHLDGLDPGRLLHGATTPSNVASTLTPFMGGPLGMAAGHGMGQPSDILPRAPLAPPAPPPVNMPPVASPPISTNNMPPPAPAPQPSQPMPPMQGLDLPFAPHVPLPTPRPTQMPPQAVPIPQARPADAPQAAPMGFFARNTAMMKDPITGNFLDPAAAQRADATGPDVIQKFMNFYHNKGAS